MAAPAASAQHSDSDLLLRRASERCRRGDVDGARALFDEIFSNDPSAHTLGEMALCEQRAGRWVEAETHLSDALEQPDDPWVRRHQGTLQQALADIRQHLGRLSIEGPPDGAELFVRDRRVGTFPMREPLRVVAGIVDVEVRAEGYRPWRRVVEILAGGATQQRVTLDAERPRESAATPHETVVCSEGFVLRNGLCYDPLAETQAAAQRGRPWRVMGFAGLGLAVASTALAIGLGVSANGDESDYLARCGGPSVSTQCVADRVNTQSSLDGQATVINIFWVVAGVSTVGAAVGFGLDAQRPRRVGRLGLSAAPAGLRVTW